MNREQIDRIDKQIGEFSGLIESSSDKRIINARRSDFSRGIFMLLTMGEFSVGKSTLINSVLAENLLEANVTATTGVITLIVYGEPNTVEVYYEGKDIPEKMSDKEFFQKFSLSKEDKDECERTHQITRFKNVQYAVIHRKSELCTDGNSIVDSPGLGESISQTKTTASFLPRANAVIFGISSCAPFSELEMEYITNNFSGRYKKNVFFVFTYADTLSARQFANLEDQVRHELKPVFTDENGRFDQKLYDSRVFYTDAYHALQIRTEGHAYSEDRFGRVTPLPDVSLESTEIPKLEKALKEFLASDEKAKSAYEQILAALCAVYMRSKRQAESDKKTDELSDAELSRRVDEAKRELDKVNSDIESLRNLYENAKTILYNEITTNMVTARREFEKGWYAHTAKGPQGKASEVFKVAWSAIESKIGIGGLNEKGRELYSKTFAPYIKHCEPYYNKCLARYEALNKASIKKVVDMLSRQTEVQCENIEEVIGNAMRMLTGNSAAAEIAKLNARGAIEMAISALFMDLDGVVVGATGEQSWKDFGKKLAEHFVVETTIYFGGILAGPIGWTLEGLYVLFSIKQAGKKQAQNEYASLKNGYLDLMDKAFDTVKNGRPAGKDEHGIWHDALDSLPDFIEKNFGRPENEILAILANQLSDNNSHLDDLLSEREDKTSSAAKRQADNDDRHSKMLGIIRNIYKEICCRDMTPADIEALESLQMKAVG